MNTDTRTFSDETLNAFIDGELDPEEFRLILEATRSDTDLNGRICELRRMRELVRFAYQEPPRPEQTTRLHSQEPAAPGFLPRSIAASLLAAACLAGGWFAHDAFEARLQTAHANETDTFTAARTDRETRSGHNVIMHVSSGDPAHLATALDTAERLANEHNGRDDHIILLTNDSGINLLRADISPYAERVSTLIAKHPNLSLIACKNGIEKLERQLGTRVALLPGSSIGRPAVEEIVSRLRDGWTYMKI